MGLVKSKKNNKMSIAKLVTEEKRVTWMSSIFHVEEYPFLRFYYVRDIIKLTQESGSKETACEVFTDLYMNRLISCHSSFFEKYYKWDRSQQDDGYRTPPNDPIPQDILDGKFHITTKGLEMLKSVYSK